MSVEWFGPRLKELREAAGLSQVQLAEKAGIGAGGLRDIEQGRATPRWDTILALCQALGVDCSAFAQEPAERPPAKPGRPPKAPPSTEEKPAKEPCHRKKP
jgi:transcriptional regulator with XRE-family HTH domain